MSTIKHFDEIMTALEESVKLQSHYAKLLNAHDGGERVPFKDADEWINRLRETGKLSKEVVETARNGEPIKDFERLLLFFLVIEKPPQDPKEKKRRFCQISGMSHQRAQWALDECAIRGLLE